MPEWYGPSNSLRSANQRPCVNQKHNNTVLEEQTAYQKRSYTQLNGTYLTLSVKYDTNKVLLQKGFFFL